MTDIESMAGHQDSRPGLLSAGSRKRDAGVALLVPSKKVKIDIVASAEIESSMVKRRCLEDLPGEVVLNMLEQVNVDSNGEIDIMTNAFSHRGVEMLRQARNPTRKHHHTAFKATYFAVKDIQVAWERCSALLAVIPSLGAPRRLRLVIEVSGAAVFRRLRPFMVQEYLQRNAQAARTVHHSFVGTRMPFDPNAGCHLFPTSRFQYLLDILGGDLTMTAAAGITRSEHVDNLIEEAAEDFGFMLPIACDEPKYFGEAN